jgi:hypothetical protein
MDRPEDHKVLLNPDRRTSSRVSWSGVAWLAAFWGALILAVWWLG